MKQNQRDFLKKSKVILSANDGVASYIEFILSFAILVFVFYTIVQIYFLISAQILVVNTTRSALREIEVYGQVKQSVIDNVKSSLEKINQIDIDSLKIRVSNPDNFNNLIDANTNIVYQLRKPIKIEISANYKLVLANASLNTQFTTIRLFSTYTGSSQKFFKINPVTHTPMDTYEVITE